MQATKKRVLPGGHGGGYTSQPSKWESLVKSTFVLYLEFYSEIIGNYWKKCTQNNLQSKVVQLKKFILLGPW
jgi:hypothetical protein